MKRLATLFILTILVATAGFAKPQKYKDLSGNIAVKGELTKVPAISRRYTGHYPPGCQNEESR